MFNIGENVNNFKFYNLLIINQLRYLSFIIYKKVLVNLSIFELIR
jgi:hypothetical protein